MRRQNAPLLTWTACKFDPWKQNGVCWSWTLASRYIEVFHGIKHYDYESTATTKRHSYSVRFFRLLCLQTGRIRRNFNCSKRIEESYAQKINLIGYLHQLLCILNERAMMSLPGNSRRIREKYGLVWGVGYSAYCNDNKEQLLRVIVARSRCKLTGVNSRLS